MRCRFPAASWRDMPLAENSGGACLSSVPAYGCCFTGNCGNLASWPEMGEIMSDVIRVFVEKKPGFDVEAQHIKADLIGNLGLSSITDLKLLNRYDVSGLSWEEFDRARTTIFSEPNVDNVYDEVYEAPEG